MDEVGGLTTKVTGLPGEVSRESARDAAHAGRFRRERFELHAAGHRLCAEWLEPDNVRDDFLPIVFLHEALGSIGQWKDFPLLVSLATGHPALVYERWGFGGSDRLTAARPVDYLDEESWESLPDVLMEAGVGRCILIGHSDGGSIALMHAARYSDRLAGVVTLAAHVFVEEVTLTGIREATERYEQGGIAERLARYHGDNTESMFRGWSDTWLKPEFRDWNIERLLPSITCPLLVLQGRDDEYGTPAQVDTIVSGVSGPVAGRLIEGCGHVPHLQAPEAAFLAVTGFIGELAE